MARTRSGHVRPSRGPRRSLVATPFTEPDTPPGFDSTGNGAVLLVSPMRFCRYATIYASSGLDQTSTDDRTVWNDAPTSTDGLSIPRRTTAAAVMISSRPTAWRYHREWTSSISVTGSARSFRDGPVF